MKKIIEYGDPDSLMFLLRTSIHEIAEFLDDNTLGYYLDLLDKEDDYDWVDGEDLKNVQKLLLTYETVAKESYHAEFRKLNMRLVK